MQINKNALLLGYYGANNLGDDMMLHCLIPWLREQGLAVTVVSEKPAATADRFATATVGNIPMLGQWSWKKSWFGGEACRLFGKIRRHDLLVVGGGDLIRDDKGWKTFSYTMEKIVCAHLLGKPVYLVNIGISEPVTSYGRILLRWSLRRTRQVIARDRRTFELAKALGCGCVELLPDIVVRLPETFPSRKASAHPRPYMVVSLREDPDAFGQYPFTEAHCRALARALDTVASSAGLDVVFIPFHGSGRHDDNLLHRQVAACMSEQSRIVFCDWTADLGVLMTWIGQARLVLGMRLHAIVLAVAMRRPCVAMPYDQKIFQFSESVNLEHFVTSEQLLDSEATSELFARLCRADVAYDLSAACAWNRLRLRP